MSLTENLQIMRDALSPDGSQSIQMLRSLVEQVQKDVDALQNEHDQLKFALKECVMHWDGELSDERSVNFIGRARKLIEANNLEAGDE